MSEMTWPQAFSIACVCLLAGWMIWCISKVYIKDDEEHTKRVKEILRDQPLWTIQGYPGQEKKKGDT